MPFTKKESLIFIKTSQTANIPNRLQKRFEAIFETRPEIWAGKRVLDIGSHDGRWAYAALKMGASHVTGIEARSYLVDNANTNMAILGVDSDRYRFTHSEAFTYMKNTDETFDIVLCLGFMYHTFDHIHLMKLMNKMNPEFIIIDTVINLGDRMSCLIKREKVTNEGNSVRNKTSFGDYNYVAVPSMPYLQSLLDDIGFNYRKVNWRPLIRKNPVGIPDYMLRRRTTMICQRKSD